MIYFTSDLHFAHANIINLCGRPFESVEQMNEALIENWNKKVRNNDTVYVVGDMVWKRENVERFLGRLKGNKILIVGNHDNWIAEESFQKYFVEIAKYKEISLNGHQMTFCHYPMLEWKNSRKGDSPKLGYHIYGHIHNNVLPEYRYLFELPNALNAGVEVNNYEPVTFEELVENNARFSKQALEILNAPAVVEMRLHDAPFYKIKSGEKTVEVRLYDDKRQKLKLGDMIKFTRRDSEEDVIETEVVSLSKFPTFKKLYASELFFRTGSQGYTAEQAAESMYSYYDRKDEEKYGVLAIGIKLIKG